ncbi:tRNA (N(6)-L-threonylcarbamoyladenosine(37)-C(2))-methylthiotransferase [Candidatus Methanomassiliicoccus intestinalis]|uniref:tRNA (N(6)-L-threonylcarbamoyladenosine(37)-C(2))- methylthiotransferase n=1 Tax=Candidatus Methanomassiliicoccus intestinalis TaxID=1406512 RepID=UPI0037DCB528
MKVYVESYGCTMNHGEGEKIETTMSLLGHEIVSDPSDADLIVLNTCTVITETQNRMLKRAKEISEDGKKLIISGCMASIQPEDLISVAPNAQIIDPKNYHKLPSLVGNGDGLPVIKNPTITSILPIAQGCLGSCTYCITRFARGTLCSYPLQDLVSEAKSLIQTGTKELLVTAQDTACYGFDTGSTLTDLITSLTSLDGRFMIRIGMMNPNNLLKILKDFMPAWMNPKVYKFIHIPVQSGSPEVLKSMQRSYSPEEFKNLVFELRSYCPEISISTDVITGFPGETDADHKLTMELIEDIMPDTVNVTRYSARPNTPAASFSHQVPGWISKDRSRELTKLRFKISESKNNSQIGKDFSGIVSEIGKPGTMIVRTNSYRPVVICEKLPLGSEVRVRITDSKSTYLIGEIISS